MIHHSYFNYPRVFEGYPQHFELMLVYQPQASKADSARLNEAISTALRSANAMTLSLPSAFKLLAAGQLQILVTKEFGELSSYTFSGKKGTRKIHIQVGASYQEYIQPEELAIMRDWCDRVMYDWAHQQCQRSPKPMHS